MVKLTVRFSSLQKKVFYTIFVALFLSGAAWFVMDSFFTVQGDFGTEPHPLRAVAVKIHGATAMLTLVLFGWLLSTHVKPGLKIKRNLMSGSGVVAIIVALTITGYLLYYAGNETIRAGSRWLHLIIGFGFPLFLLGHVILGKRQRRKKSHILINKINIDSHEPKENLRQAQM